MKEKILEDMKKRFYDRFPDEGLFDPTKGDLNDQFWNWFKEEIVKILPEDKEVETKVEEILTDKDRVRIVSSGLLPINPSFNYMQSKFIDDDVKEEFKDKSYSIGDVINLQLVKNTKKLTEEMAETNRIERVKLGEITLTARPKFIVNKEMQENRHID